MVINSSVPSKALLDARATPGWDGWKILKKSFRRCWVMRIPKNFNNLRGKKVVITAGPTREYWDPVRYLSNASSGHMGIALAQEARNLGAHVALVLGPVTVPVPR